MNTVIWGANVFCISMMKVSITHAIRWTSLYPTSTSNLCNPMDITTSYFYIKLYKICPVFQPSIENKATKVARGGRCCTAVSFESHLYPKKPCIKIISLALFLKPFKSQRRLVEVVLASPRLLACRADRRFFA